MEFNNGFRAIGLASIVALAVIVGQAPSVAAVDPSPSPSAPVVSPLPTATAAPSPSATPAPSPSATPAPTTAPAASPTPSPVPSATSDPTVAVATVATAALAPVARPDHRTRIVKIALAQRGKRYRSGAVGPRAFDCSGLVRFAYRRAGVTKSLGGGHSARGMYRWARMHGLTSKRNPRVGDVVIWGGGSHAGIYIGHGRVISALNPRQGIRVTRLHALRQPFTTFIHTRVS